MLSVVSLIGAAAAAASGEAFASTARASYGPPPVTTTVPPGGFTAVVTTVSIGPAGGTIGPVAVDGVDLAITVPAGTFSTPVEITVTAPDLATIIPPAGSTIVAGGGIAVTANGPAYPGTFLKPITATFRSSKVITSSDVMVWNGTSFVVDPDSTTAAGVATVSFDTDPDFAIVSPVSSPVTQVPEATTPVTGEPFLGEVILAGVLVLAGAGGFAASRRRRGGVLSAARYSYAA